MNSRVHQFTSILASIFLLGLVYLSVLGLDVDSSYFVNRAKQQDLMNLLGAMYAAVLFLGATNASAVQSIVAIERTVFYRERAAGMYSPLPYAFAQVTPIRPSPFVFPGQRNPSII